MLNSADPPDDTELGRDHIKAFGDVFADLVQVAATAAGRCRRLDHFLNARQVLGQRAAVGIAGFGRAGFGRINRLILGVDRSNRCLTRHWA